MSKVVLVTGGSSGLGKAIGEFLLLKGFKVYGTSRNPENYNDNTIPLLPLDVTDATSIKTCVKILLEKEDHIDILINNAGSGITGPIEEIPHKELKRNFETNLFGPIQVIKAVLPNMRNNNSGLIINITSIAGYMGLPYRGVYSASKGALELLTEALSMEVKAFNIKVVNLAPGDFATNIASGRYHAPIQQDSPYKESYEASLKMMDDHVNSGSNPIEVAEKVLSIIHCNNPKLHYKVGAFMQKFSIVLKRILPDRVYEKLLLNHYKL